MDSIYVIIMPQEILQGVDSMPCEFNYCVYNNGSACILTKTRINHFGMCDLCEIVDIPQEDIERYKEKRLQELKKLWAAPDEK